MKWVSWLPLVLLATMPVCAKPKVEVRVHVNDALGRDRASDSINKANKPAGGTMLFQTVWFMNITVTSDDAAAVAKGNGKWCITGIDALDVNDEYRATLDGNNLEILVFLKNGKAKKWHYEIFDHKWRKLSDL